MSYIFYPKNIKKVFLEVGGSQTQYSIKKVFDKSSQLLSEYSEPQQPSCNAHPQNEYASGQRVMKTRMVVTCLLVD